MPIKIEHFILSHLGFIRTQHPGWNFILVIHGRHRVGKPGYLIGGVVFDLIGDQFVRQATQRVIHHGDRVGALIGRILIVNRLRCVIGVIRQRPANQHQNNGCQNQNDPKSCFIHIDSPLASSSLPCASRIKSHNSRTAPRPPAMRVT